MRMAPLATLAASCETCPLRRSFQSYRLFSMGLVLIGCQSSRRKGCRQRLRSRAQSDKKRQMMPDWIREIREYQTLIGAVIAVVGVSWTLYWNARAGRRLEQFKSEQQRVALLAALRAELAGIQSMLSAPLQDFLISITGTPPPWLTGIRSMAPPGS